MFTCPLVRWAGGPNHLRQTANRVRGSSRRTAALQAMLRFSTSAVGYTDQTSRFYRPVSFNLKLMFKLHLSLRFKLVQLICVFAMCVGFALMKGLNYASVCVYFGEPMNQRLHFDVCVYLLLHVSLRLAFPVASQPFFTWFVLSFTSFS